MHKIRNDIILISILLLIAAISLILFFSLSKKDNLNVLIYQDQELVYSASLSEDNEFNIEQVHIVIKDQNVYVLSSNCKDQTCVHQGKINRAGQTIVCLPNKISIRLEGKQVDVGI